jgi:hypothetical protein
LTGVDFAGLAVVSSFGQQKGGEVEIHIERGVCVHAKI